MRCIDRVKGRWSMSHPRGVANDLLRSLGVSGYPRDAAEAQQLGQQVGVRVKDRLCREDQRFTDQYGREAQALCTRLASCTMDQRACTEAKTMVVLVIDAIASTCGDYLESGLGSRIMTMRRLLTPVTLAPAGTTVVQPA